LSADLWTLSDWTEGIVRAKTAGFAAHLADRAVALREELLASAPEPVLLHADLHHFNILAAERQPWLAIDPKAVIGDPAYEPAAFLRNPVDRLIGAPDCESIVARRIDQFAEHFDRSRLTGWAFVHSVLSAWWSFEDHGRGHEPALRFAELLVRLGEVG
jgi:streptomycin 6-kinase